ncbi:hypothetical protein O9G_002028 [Rozella allomycis CSF55]|uniref:Non-haem dioxygenase N-terminal domain-containing protein n=1 Tax=Rozella allomycis (strain CSF55) TaxID=988480 RepID=A0A075AXB6_ROZAC|nr:hypothetical protein O9G_002028 [Rozella allomycis CSF55]|eukprot:EPZ34897.1 hypothetical protein O9G_002028 [Rozella allomycis CSF55]
MTIDRLPVVDIDKYVTEGNNQIELCLQVSNAFREFGAIAIRDSRVPFEKNEHFLDILEKYFSQDEEALMRDSRPEIGYQIGVTPEGIEAPRCIHDTDCQNFIDSLKEEDKPVKPTRADVKWRYFHRIGPRPLQTKFPELNATPILNGSRILCII